MLTRLRYELLLMGRRVILTPPLAVLGFALFAVLLHYLQSNPALFLTGCLEMILPLAAGIMVGMVATTDSAIEVQLALPRAYHLTALSRVILILLWTACIALIASAILSLLNLQHQLDFMLSWSLISRFSLLQLTWLAPLLWCVGFGLTFALLFQSRTAGPAVLSSIWLFEIFFRGYIVVTPWLLPIFLYPTTLLLFSRPTMPYVDFVTYWLNTRLEVLGGGLLLLFVGWLLLRNTERVLKGAGEE